MRKKRETEIISNRAINANTVVDWNLDTLADGRLLNQEYNNIYNIIKAIFPNFTDYDPTDLGSFVKHNYIQFLQLDFNTSIDEVKWIPLIEDYWNEFIAQLQNTDFGVADGGNLPADASHIIRGDSVTKFLDLRGNFLRGSDVQGVNVPEMTGKYGGTFQMDAMQKMVGRATDYWARGGGRGSGVLYPIFDGGFKTAGGPGNTLSPTSVAFDNSRDPNIRTAPENRPRNISGLFIQRYKFSNIISF